MEFKIHPKHSSRGVEDEAGVVSQSSEDEPVEEHVEVADNSHHATRTLALFVEVGIIGLHPAHKQIPQQAGVVEVDLVAVAADVAVAGDRVHGLLPSGPLLTRIPNSRGLGLHPPQGREMCSAL